MYKKYLVNLKIMYWVASSSFKSHMDCIEYTDFVTNISWFDQCYMRRWPAATRLHRARF